MRKLTSLSGKVKKNPSTQADENRYDFLDLQNAEPDLGVPQSNSAILSSSTNGSRSWLYIDSGLRLDQSDLSVDVNTAFFDTTGFSFSSSNTLYQVISDLDSNLSSATAGSLTSVSSDSTLSGAGTTGSPLSVVDDGHTHTSNKITDFSSSVTSIVDKLYVENLGVSYTSLTDKPAAVGLPDMNIEVALTGDLTGSGNNTFIELANGTITVSATVVDDSHNHTVSTITDFTSGANTAIDNRVTKAFVDTLNVDAETLDGANGSFYLDYNNFTNTPSIPQSGIDFDPVGTDNSTDVTLAGSYDYLTITGQQITLNQIDATTDVSGLATVATSGSYNDLTDKPTDSDTTYDLVSPGSGVIRLSDSANSNDDITFVGSGATTVSSNATHITISSTDNNTTYSAGDGIDLTGTTFSHADTSTQASLSVLSGGAVVSDIDLDGFGHVTSLSTRTLTTTDIGEGTNLYYTTARANTDIDARVTKSFVDALNVDADTLDGANGSFYLDYSNFTNTPSIPVSGVDFDPVGTDNSTDVTLAGSYDYLTITGQQITLNQIDYTTDISNLPTLYTTSDANTDIDARVTQAFVNALNVTAAGVQTNSVALGADTTGNYVATISGTANEIEVTGSGSETAAVTIGLPDDVTIGNNLIVSGNLTVSGTTTTVNTETINLADNIITLNSNETGAPSQNAGLEIERGTSDNVFLRWNEGSDVWETTNDGTNFYRLLTTSDEGAGNGLDADTLDGQQGSHYLDYSNFTNTPTIGDATVTISAGSGLSTGGSFTTNQVANSTVTISHADTSTQASLTALTGGNVVSDIDLDGFGHVTGLSTRTLTTTDIGEGTNLYYTTARANTDIDARVTKSFVDSLNVDADTLDGANGSFYLDYDNFVNTPSIPQSGVDFDPVGTDNSTDVTLAGSYDYLTITGQQITLNQIDYTTDISNTPTIGDGSITFSGDSIIGVSGSFSLNDTANSQITLSVNAAAISITESQISDFDTYLPTADFTATANTWLATRSTSNLSEGTNLYYTTARANTDIDARVTKSFVDALNVDADTLDGQDGSYYLDYNNFTNTPTDSDTTYDLTIPATGTIRLSDSANSNDDVVFVGSGATTVSSNTTHIIISSTDNNTTYSAGNGIDLSGTTFSVAAGSGLTQDSTGLSHSDTSTQASLTALTGANVVSDIDLDGFGHVTSLATRAMTLADLGYTGETDATADQTITAGTGLTGGGTGDVTINHSNSITAGTVSEGGVTRTLAYGGSFNVPSVTYDAQGHITGTATVALTLPASDNTDTTYSAGDGLTLTSTTFLVNTAGDSSLVANSSGLFIDDSTLSIATSQLTGDVALGTQTSGNYVATTTGGTGVTITGGTGEGSTPTIEIGQDVSSTANVTFQNGTFTGDLQIDGDFTVSGNVVTINVQELSVEDNLIYLNANSAQTNPDLGWAGSYNDGTYAHAGMFRDASDGVFKVFDSYTPEPDASAFIDTSHSSFSLADIQATTFIGTLNGTANNATNLNGQAASFYLNYNNFTNTPTIGDATVTISAGSGLTTGGTFTTNQVANSTVTIAHADTSTQASLTALTGGNVVSDIDLDGFGHVTNLATRTLTTSDIGEGTNLYYTVARANTAIDNRVTQSFVNALNVTAAGVQADSVALGTDTTGNYVATISGTANEIEVTGSGSETAAVTIGLPNDVDIAGSITIASLYDLIGETANTTTTTQTEIASFTAATYSSGKFVIQATDTVSGEVHVTELLIVHDGTTASATEYGTIHTGSSPLATYDVDIDTGNVRVLATAASTNSTTYKVTENLITA